MGEYDAEVINIGNELLIGRTVNTNATWICKKLTLLGFNVKRVTVVGDVLEDIVNVVREALSRRPKVIIMSGGLGPTFDDMTSEALAKALNRRWIVNEEALKMIGEKYRKMGLQLTEHRIKMAKMPEGATPLPNPVGTAPGIMVKYEDTLIFALPGVPAEMRGIFEEHVENIIKEVAPTLARAEGYLYVEGIPESSAAPLIERVMKSNPKVYIKSHPRGREEVSKIIYHIISYDEDEVKAKDNVEKALRELEELLKREGVQHIRRISGDEYYDLK